MINLQKELESLEEMYNKGLMNTEEYNHMVNEIKQNIQEEPESYTPSLVTAPPIITAQTEIKPPPSVAPAAEPFVHTEQNSSSISIGSIIPFGDYNWRVLDVQNNKALILTENVIEESKYNKEDKDITWGKCTLRKYLNSKFLQKFTSEQQKRIEETLITNNNNPWYGTEGGSDTKDKIFLLSIEEVVKYFGDSGQLKNKNPKSEEWLDDQYNSKRITKFGNEARGWLLRSPGCYSTSAAYVYKDGGVSISGNGVGLFIWGVRPALWLKVNMDSR